MGWIARDFAASLLPLCYPCVLPPDSKRPENAGILLQNSRPSWDWSGKPTTALTTMTSARLRRWHRLWHRTWLQHRLLSAELRLKHKVHSILHDSEQQEEDVLAASSLEGMSMRCDICRRFRLHQTNTEFHKSSTTIDDMNNFARLSELHQQASAGCPLCASLAEAVKVVLPSDTTRKRSLGITRRSPKDERETLRFLVIDKQPFGRDEALQLADFEIFAAKGRRASIENICIVC